MRNSTFCFSPHGLYETAIEVNHYPYLEREEKKAYDMFPVSTIMSRPVTCLGPRERVQTLVKLLRESNHNGFPVVDPATREFLGLVRRDQLVALLEFGVWDEDTTAPNSGSSTPTPKWTPQPGIGKSPLMHLAYHIKDDRYEYVDDTKVTHSQMEEDDEEEDIYDTNAWISTVRSACEHLDEVNEATAQAALIANDDLPLSSLSKGEFSHRNDDKIDTKESKAVTKPLIGTNHRGNLFIAWMDPAYKRHWVRVAAVMNRGTYTVNQHCPVSKAHAMFTALGLRHLIVLGAQGRVVGILTRINLLKESIQERTGVVF